MRESDKLGMNIRRRIGVMLLSLIVAVSMMPVFAFAEDEPAQDPAPQSETVQEQNEESEEIQVEAVSDSDAADMETTADEAAVTETPDAGAEIPAEAVAGTAGGEDANIVEEIPIDSEAVRLTGSMDDDQLLEEYLQNEVADKLAQGAESGIRTRRGDRLRGKTRRYYDILMAGISDIVEGKTTSTVITIDLKEFLGDKLSYTAADLGVSSLFVEGQFSPIAKQTLFEKFYLTSGEMNVLYSAILYDCPYKLFWHDKCRKDGAFVFKIEPGLYKSDDETSVFFKDKTKIKFELYVSKDYSKTGDTDTLEVDSSKIERANDAAKEAAKLVRENSNKTDYDKLCAYKEYICINNEYNHDANNAYNAGNKEIYGDPWQMISVFDKDPLTNVVCEGYSKAFQFLCDNTEFTSPIVECYTVTGRTNSDYTYYGTVSNDQSIHMWNTIRMNDGKYYLVDITNCDGTGSFAPDLLFLKGCASGSKNAGYRYNGKNNRYVYYRYDADTLSMYTFELELSNADYKTSASNAALADILSLISGRATDDDNREIAAVNERHLAAVRAQNAIIEAARRAAEEAAKAAAKKKHVHSYRAYNRLDDIRYVCTGCSHAYTVSKVVVDLPKVTIKKPSRGKASFTAKWKKVSKKNRNKITGIEIQYCTKKDFTSAKSWLATAGKTRTSAKFKRLARKNTYYVRVRSYKVIKGKKHVSKWSAVKKVTTK